MPDDMFLSNQNYINFQNSKKLLVKTQKTGKLKQNVEKLLQTHADFVVDAATNLKEIAKTLKRN